MFAQTFMKKGAVYVNTDLSKNMIEIFEENFKNVDATLESLDSWKEVEAIPDGKKVAILRANNESLPFPDGYFDCYVSSLSLQIVDNHKNQLLEAYRVLQEGSIAGFTVWGDYDKCRTFSFLNATMNKLGIECDLPPTIAHSFGLNDRKKLKQDILDAGFKTVKMFSTMCNIGFESDEFITMGLLRPEFEKVIEDKGLEKEQDELWAKVLKEYEDTFGDHTDEILDFENIVCIAKK